MSLIIDADSEWLEATGGAFAASGIEAATFGIWVKRVSGTSTTQGYAKICPDLTIATPADGIGLAHSSTIFDGWVYAGNVAVRLNVGTAGDTNSTGWQLLVFTYTRTEAPKAYAGKVGSALITRQPGTANAAAWSAGMAQIRIGNLAGAAAAWYARARLAHCFFYDIALSAAQIGELHNGGTAGNGKHPTAVASANLKFYAPLNDDATVHTGGVTLTPTGTLTYDGADNPPVDAEAGAGVAPGAGRVDITGYAPTVTQGAGQTLAPGAGRADVTGYAPTVTRGVGVTTSILVNNTGTPHATTAVSWTYFPSGRIGSLEAVTQVDGSGTTDSNGQLTVNGLVLPGVLAIAVLNTGATDDDVYYEAFA